MARISDLGDLVNDLSFLDQKDVCEGGQRWRWEAVKGRVVQSVKFYGISDVNVSAPFFSLFSRTISTLGVKLLLN